MSHHINPAIGYNVGLPISKDSFWFKSQELTNHMHTKQEGDKRVFKNSSVYVIHNTENSSNYYILVNDKHEVLFDTSIAEEMAIHIEKIKTLD